MRITTLLHRTRARFRQLRRDEAGASVLEWAMIAAVVVVAAALIGATIFNIVQDKSGDLEKCSKVAAGQKC